MMSHGEMTWTSGLIPMIEPEVVTEIISRIVDLALVISREGTVLGVMANPNFMPQTDLAKLEGASLDEELTVESIPKFQGRLVEFLETSGNVLPVELNHKAKDTHSEFPMRYSFHQVGTDGAILMLGRDLRPIAEMQQQLVAAQIALEKDYEAQREYDTRFRVLMSSSSEVTFFVSVATGAIADCNAAAATFFSTPRNDLIGTAFTKLFDAKQSTDLIRVLAEAGSSNLPSPITSATKKTRRELEISPTLFRSGGEQVLLCRITAADGQSMRSHELSDNLTALYNSGVDAIVFMNRSGGILSANEAFQNLTDVTHAQSMRGRSMADFLSRGSVDLNVLLENTQRTGAMRLYATRLVSEHGTERPVEISTTKLGANGESVFALIVRDASRVDAIRSPAPQVTDVDMRSVIELIGSQTLKDIVAKTTDVVEKMCIETAVELTSNNRVAAAEMLGLSRQSLYVKLRKYDLL
jgi:transcriptional regulator PpsR